MRPIETAFRGDCRHARSIGALAHVELRIIKGCPFEVGFECDAELYRKEHPMKRTGLMATRPERPRAKALDVASSCWGFMRHLRREQEERGVGSGRR